MPCRNAVALTPLNIKGSVLKVGIVTSVHIGTSGPAPVLLRKVGPRNFGWIGSTFTSIVSSICRPPPSSRQCHCSLTWFLHRPGHIFTTECCMIETIFQRFVVWKLPKHCEKNSSFILKDLLPVATATAHTISAKIWRFLVPLKSIKIARTIGKGISSATRSAAVCRGNGNETCLMKHKQRSVRLMIVNFKFELVLCWTLPLTFWGIDYSFQNSEESIGLLSLGPRPEHHRRWGECEPERHSRASSSCLDYA